MQPLLDIVYEWVVWYLQIGCGKSKLWILIERDVSRESTYKDTQLEVS